MSCQINSDIFYQSIVVENEIKQEQSEINFVKDYIIVKVKKGVEEQWENSYKINDEHFDDF